MGVKETFLRGLEERLQDFGFSEHCSYSEDKKTPVNIYEKRINELFPNIEDKTFLSIEISCLGENVFKVEFGCNNVPRHKGVVNALGSISTAFWVENEFSDLDLILKESYKMAKFNNQMEKGN